MKKIHVLPPEIISKIAAGEVIERPASVIKELLENALDAGTDSIELRLQQAGKTLIAIKDTGCGIAQEDMETIFQRHSTSKIASIDDLFAIHSLGFRGEALYSIAAIADVTLHSKTADQDSGWGIHLRGGQKLNFRPVSMLQGTEIQVKELFFNTPARRKFLKSQVSEINQILNVVIPYTLLHHKCRFLLQHEDKTLLDLQSTDEQRARIATTLRIPAEHILEFKQEDHDQKISIHMFLGDINITRSRRDMQFIFINGRPVDNKALSFHINEVYRLILPPRNYPFFALFVQIPAADIDANVHPTKREVKIRDEQSMASFIRHLCERTLMTSGQAKQATTGQTELAARENGETETSFKALTTSQMPYVAPQMIRNALARTHQEDFSFDGNLPPDIFHPSSKTSAQQPLTEQYAFPREHPLSIVGETLFHRQQESLQEKLMNSRYIGAFMHKFLFFEAGSCLLVVDQHAAQERITFEQFIEQMDGSRIEVQHLLSPYLLKLSAQELLLWEEAKERMSTIGFDTTQFDAQTVAVHTYPVLIKQPEKAVRDILAGGNVARIDHETIARRACRASIMAGDKLDLRQAVFLREQLAACRDPFTCPHGRPTVIEMKEDFLDKQFLRS
jgi:DNA mismatch repair protein MutL